MREIKFRAWNINDKEMFKVEQITFANNCDEFGASILDKHNDFHKIKDIELMQFTGLKDKNGKEIYEGDILTSNYIVSWNNKLCGFIVKHSNKLLGYPLYETGGLLDLSLTEILGNIYENPELLKEKNE